MGENEHHFLNTLDNNDLNDLAAADESVVATDDLILVYDVSANLFKKMTIDNLQDEIDTTGSAAFAVGDITGATELASGLASTDELVLSDGGVLKRMDISVLQTYMQSSLTFTTNTNQLTTFVLEDDSGDEVTISQGKEVKIIGGTGITTNWTDTDNGTDGDPYDLTIALDIDEITSNASDENSILTIDGDGTLTAEALLQYNDTDGLKLREGKGLLFDNADGDRNSRIYNSGASSYSNVDFWTGNNTTPRKVISINHLGKLTLGHDGTDKTYILPADNTNASSGKVLAFPSSGYELEWVAQTDTVYTHPSGAGNKHIPTGGSSGEFLKYDSSGTAVWATPSYTTNTNTTYSAGSGITLSTTTFSHTAHTGEVTGATSLTITDDVVDEANLKISNAGSDGQFLSKQSGDTGGLTWATPTDTNTQNSAATIRTLIGSGNNGHVPTAGTSGHFLKHDGTFGLPAYTTNTDTTYSVMASGNSYAAGLVAAGHGTHGGAFLRKDGTWVVPPDTDTTIANTDTTYSISCADGDNTDEEKIVLTAGGSGSGTDAIVLEAGTGLSIARSSDKITFTNTVTDTDTTYSVMASGNSYAAGLVAAGSATHGGYFLRKDGTWVVPPDTNTDTNTTYSAGTGMSLVGTTFNCDITDTNTTYSAGTLLDLSTTTFNVDLSEAAETAIAVADDYFLFLDGGATGTAKKESFADLATAMAGSNVTATNGVFSVAANTDTNTQLSQEQVEDFVNGLIVGGTNVTATYDDAAGTLTLASTDTDTVYTHPTGAGNFHLPAGGSSGQFLAYSGLSGVGSWITPSYIAQLTTEEVQDIVGAMFTSNTETRITATYQDADGTIDLVVDDLDTDTTYSEATGSAAGLMSIDHHDKLDGIEASANNYSHPTGGGNYHVPNNGSAGQFLGFSGLSGIASWLTPPDTNTQTTYTPTVVDSSDDALIRLTAAGAGSGTQDIKLVAGSNVTLTPDATTTPHQITIAAAGSSGGENNEYSFKTIEVSGQTNVVADTTTDTLTFVEAGGMTITTSGDEITFTSADTNTDTTYTAGALLDLSGTTFNVDLSELTDGTGAIVGSTDELVYLDNGVQKRKRIAEITLSDFDNDRLWTANVGSVTSVTAGAGMTQTGTSTVNPTLNVVGGTGITANANDIALSSGAALTNLGGGSGTTFLKKDGTWATPSGGSSTDSFMIFGEESDDYLSSTAGAGNANGFAFAFGNGAHNTTKSSSGVDFGIPVGCDCTLKAVYIHCGNKASDTSTGTLVFDVYKNESAESNTFSGDGNSSSGNAFLISKTDYDIDFSAGDRFNIRVTGPSGYGAKVGPSRMSAYFERQ